MASPITMTAARETLEARIRRFPRSTRRSLRKLVKGSSRLGELLFSFPAAAFVLVTGNRSHLEKGAAVAAIKEGRSLNEVARVLRLPLWLRKLPPEAFGSPLDEIPNEVAFTRCIANHIPSDEACTAMWLAWVLFGAKVVGDDFAIWIASQKIFQAQEPQDKTKMPLLVLAAYAWFSQSHGNPGRGLIVEPWTPQMTFAKTVEHACVWFERIVYDYCREGPAAFGTWFKERKSCGYRFVPLRMPSELHEEGRRMNNCLATYTKKVASGACLIYSIRRCGEHVAAMEIVAAQAGRGQPAIAQLLGPGNKPVTEDVRRAAGAWLDKQGRYPMAVGKNLHQVPLQARKWSRVWEPFYEANPSHAHSFLDPDQGVIGFRDQLEALSRLVKSR